MADKWEYKVLFSTRTTQEMETSLNKLGNEGWELVTIHEYLQGPVAFLKRKKQ